MSSDLAMGEPRQLLSARQHLSQAEAKYRSRDGLFHLEEGLALLEEMMACDVPEHRTIARNLAATYSEKIFSGVRRLVETDPALPEPELEQLFKIVLAFDERGIELPVDARAAKVAVVKHLIDRYYEGYSPDEKQAVLEQLARISGKRTKRKGRARK